MFRNVKQMPAADKVETLLNVYVGSADDATPADRLRAAVKKALGKGLTRFDPHSDLEEGDAPTPLPEELFDNWAKMNLDDCHGWPCVMPFHDLP